MPLFITPTTEWPSMVFFICLSIYFYNFGFMHCLNHSMRLWPVHSRNIVRVSALVPTDDHPIQSGHSVLPWAPSFPHELLNYLRKILALHHSLGCQIWKCRSLNLNYQCKFICVTSLTDVYSLYYKDDLSQWVKRTDHIKLHYFFKVIKLNILIYGWLHYCMYQAGNIWCRSIL